MRNWGMAVLLAAGVLGFGGWAAAGPVPAAPNGERAGGVRQGPRFGDFNPEGMILRLMENPRVAEELGLTEDQKKALQDKVSEFAPELGRLRTELEQTGKEQARLLTDESATETQLMDAVEKTGQIRMQLAKINMKQLLAVRNSLSAEQRKKLREMVQKRTEEWRVQGAGLGRGAEEKRGRGLRPGKGTDDRNRGEKVDRGNRPEEKPEGSRAM